MGLSLKAAPVLLPCGTSALPNPRQKVPLGGWWGCRRALPFSDGAVEFQALDGHGGPPVGVLRLEDGAEAPPAQVVQVRQLLVGDHRQVAGQAANVHAARGRGRLHRRLNGRLREASGDLFLRPRPKVKEELPFCVSAQEEQPSQALLASEAAVNVAPATGWRVRSADVGC